MRRVCASTAGVEPRQAATRGERNHCITITHTFPRCTSLGRGGKRRIVMNMHMNKVVMDTRNRAAETLGKLYPIAVCLKSTPPNINVSGAMKVTIIAHTAHV